MDLEKISVQCVLIPCKLQGGGGSEILAKSDFFGSMKDAGIFWGCKKNREMFLGGKKGTKRFFWVY